MATKKKEETPTAEDCFVIMPISDQTGYEPNHFTLVYEDIIRPAINKAAELLGKEIKPRRADETKGSNLIQLDILQKVIKSPIAICDMSAKNPNVFYELGMRQAFDAPTVLMIDDETTAPFDVNGLRYVKYSKSMKYRLVNTAIEDLAECLVDTYNNKDNTSEVNSLIRLMDLVDKPAELKESNLSTHDKQLRRLELMIRDLAEKAQTDSATPKEASSPKYRYVISFADNTPHDNVDDFVDDIHKVYPVYSSEIRTSASNTDAQSVVFMMTSRVTKEAFENIANLNGCGDIKVVELMRPIKAPTKSPMRAF
ncbi:hypothetical protein ACPSLZ_23485 [Vibrio campbellii]|uniref:hypothetical protein n=1 Tax=Vibrio campbellii TaxID=680 RepID=UPI003CE522FE